MNKLSGIILNYISRKIDSASLSRTITFVLLLLSGITLRAQDLSWLNRDGTDGTGGTAVYSENLTLSLDADGNAYALYHYNGQMELGSGNSLVRLESTLGQDAVIAKFDPAGELLWFKEYTFLSNRRMVMDVSPEGSVLLVAEVRGDSEITFDGQTWQTDPLIDYMFFLWLDKDGELVNWEWKEEVFEDFNLEQLVDVYLYDDLSFWLTGGYAKEQLGENFTRHDIEFLTYHSPQAEQLNYYHFETGPRGQVEEEWIQLDRFQEVGGELLMPSYSNGYFGQDQGDRVAGTHHGALHRIIFPDNVVLELVVTDATDLMHHVLTHGDGSYSMLVTSEDGILNTSKGDFNLGIQSKNALVRFRLNELISVTEMPPLNGDLVPVAGRDDLVAFRGWTSAGSIVNDGHGNTLKAPTDGPNNVGLIFIYNQAGQLEFNHFFEVRGVSIPLMTTLLVDGNCNGFHLGGYTLGDVNLEIGRGTPRYSQDFGSVARHYLAKYENEAPWMVAEEEISFCPDAERQFEVEIKDEYLSGVEVSVYAPNSDFDQTLVGLSGSGVKRTLNLENAALPDEYTLGIRLTDACGKSTEQEIAIRLVDTPDAPVLAQAGEYVLCEGDTLKLTATTIDDFPLLWSDGRMGDTLKIFEAGNYSVQQLAGVNCTSPGSDTLRVTMAVSPEMPEIMVEGGLVLCPGETVTLTASLSERLVWSNGATSQSITVDQPGIYSVYQTSDLCGNSEASQVEVRYANVSGPPVIEVDGNTQFCEGGEVTLRSSAGEFTVWSTGERGAEISVNSTGEFWAKSYDGNCEGLASETVTIIVNQPFSIELVRDTTICDFFEPLELVPAVSEQGLDFLWSDGTTGSSLIVNEPGEYWVEVNNGACTEVAQVTVEELCLPQVYMPNAFSPNGDNDNDVFGPVGQRVIDFRMTIFNQWGRMVYTTQDINQGWDGTFEGKQAPAGKYVYQVIYNGLVKGELLSYSQNGKLDLIR